MFFRAERIADAFRLLRRLVPVAGDWQGLLLSQGKWDLALLAGGAALYLGLGRLRRTEDAFFGRPLVVRWACYGTLLAGCRFLAVSSNSFIYLGF